MTKRVKRHFGTTVLFMFMVGCGSNAPVDLMPAPEPASMDSLMALRLPPVVEDDSAADEAALRALRELHFGSLAKGGGHVHATMSAPTDLDVDVLRMRSTGSRGGASASGVTYDLDVESFLSNRRVQYYREFFLDPARSRFEVWLARLGRYEGMIHRVFRQYGLPDDLVYLALIESGMSNTAVSRARAVGMWQFIAPTGRRYGLRIDDWVDERRDPYKATDAAARFLSDLNDRFGSWYLAAAAYNGGPGRVSRGLRRLGPTQSSDTTFFDLADRRYLRRETRDYVPKLIAATSVAKEAQSYGFRDYTKQAPLQFDEITVPGQTGLDVLATLADTSTRALLELNPQFFRRATPPNERATVRVPRGTGHIVLERYADLPVADRVNFLEHRIRRGETLGGIAKRYGLRVADIRAANRGVRARRLQIGQRLTIPVSSSARLQSRTSRARPASKRTVVSAPSNGFHTVRRGDTLWELSHRYGVTIDHLRRWNRIPENVSMLSVGEPLRVVAPN